jgi:hypothetical protein
MYHSNLPSLACIARLSPLFAEIIHFFDDFEFARERQGMKFLVL